VPPESNGRRPENELSKLLNRDFPADTEASGAVTDAISETLAQLLVPEQKHSAFRLEPPRNNSRVVGKPETTERLSVGVTSPFHSLTLDGGGQFSMSVNAWFRQLRSWKLLSIDLPCPESQEFASLRARHSCKSFSGLLATISPY
jgi:hypothetical protein